MGDERGSFYRSSLMGKRESEQRINMNIFSPFLRSRDLCVCSCNNFNLKWTQRDLFKCLIFFKIFYHPLISQQKYFSPLGNGFHLIPPVNTSILHFMNFSCKFKMHATWRISTSIYTVASDAVAAHSLSLPHYIVPLICTKRMPCAFITRQAMKSE